MPSKPVTTWPSFNRRLARWKPMNPAVPVTKYFKPVSMKAITAVPARRQAVPPSYRKNLRRQPLMADNMVFQCAFEASDFPEARERTVPSLDRIAVRQRDRGDRRQ